MEYKLTKKDRDDFSTTDKWEAIGLAKSACDWDDPVCVFEDGVKIHEFERGYDNHIFDKLD